MPGRTPSSTGSIRVSVEVVGVVGAGFMGSGIAESIAAAGKRVIVYEPADEPLERSRGRLAASLERAVSRGKLERAHAAALTDRITYTTRFEDLAQAGAAIEAVSENLKLKGEIFARLDETLADAVFLASNTSSIPIADIAAHVARPQRVLGLHFFSPVPVMKLVEVVVGLDTDAATVAAADAFAAELGKHAIHAKDRAGFIVNLLLAPYLMAAVRMFEEGFASAEDIDRGLELGCGHPMGPLTLCDFIGLDVLLDIADSLHGEFGRPEYAAPPLLRRMVAAGRRGRKSGRGFYEYGSPA
jgi:3-hydroxybutyryl-CoA dehydrogenase